MVEIERSPGQGVRIGPYTLRVVAVHPDCVVIALRDPDDDDGGAEPPAPAELLARDVPDESPCGEPVLA